MDHTNDSGCAGSGATASSAPFAERQNLLGNKIGYLRFSRQCLVTDILNQNIAYNLRSALVLCPYFLFPSNKPDSALVKISCQFDIPWNYSVLYSDAINLPANSTGI
jgi:hypothetical protein